MKQWLHGHVQDMGDVLIYTKYLLKKNYSPIGFIFRIGAVRDSDPADRVVQGTPVPATGKVDLIMDLMSDKSLPLGPGWTDENGNPTPEAPVSFTAVYSVDDTSILNLVDNGDGTAVVTPVGPLGTATVHGEATIDGGAPQTGDLQVVVVAGLAERFNIVAGTPFETTPDV